MKEVILLEMMLTGTKLRHIYHHTEKNVEAFPLCFIWQEPTWNVASAWQCKASHQHQDSLSHHTTWTDGFTASTLQTRLSTFIFSPIQIPERCHSWKKVLVRWWCGQHHQKLAASTGQGMVPVRHTCPCSTLAQSYRITCRLQEN